MPYTAHGHWYGHNDPDMPPPAGTTDCGGLALCPECARDAHRHEGTGPVYPFGPLTNNPLPASYTITVPSPAVKPTIGRIVHYVSHGTPVRKDGSQAFTSQCRAAIITDLYTADHPHPDPEVWEGAEGAEWVALAVLNPTGLFFHSACHDEPGKQGGTWHWPERAS